MFVRAGRVQIASEGLGCLDYKIKAARVKADTLVKWGPQRDFGRFVLFFFFSVQHSAVARTKS